MQFGIFGFGLLVNWDVRIGILPERQEILVRLARSGFIAHHRLRPAELEMRQRPRHVPSDDGGMIEQLLKLRRRRLPPAQLKIGQTAEVSRINTIETVRKY